MLIDTHCHLDAGEFDADRLAVISRARQQQVTCIVVPAVTPGNFKSVQTLARSEPGLVYALGIHPCFTSGLADDALDRLHQALHEARDDPKLVAIGEIGLDFFIPDFDTEHQESIYQAQLRLAREFDLPVILHGRRSHDRLLKYLRRTPVRSGIAHAFNGSVQQAQAYLDLGFALGFGGAMTYRRARQIRRLAAHFPSTAYVLETDAPDLAPEWQAGQRNEPSELRRIAGHFADLRNEPLDQLVAQTAVNAHRVLPGLNKAT